MIKITVELHSAVTGRITKLGSATICNDGTGTKERGNYILRLFGKNDIAMKMATINGWPRLQRHAWALIAALLAEIYRP